MPNARRLLSSALALLALACESNPAPEPAVRALLASHEVNGEDAGVGGERLWHAGAPGTFPERLSYHNGQQTITTINLSGPIDTATHPFFKPLGSNGRACITCHQPADGMSISAASAAQLWDESHGADPLFAAIDGSNCPSLPQQARASHSLLLEHGLFRIARPWPPRAEDGSAITPEFTLEVVRDPTGCNLDRRYGLQSATPMVSVFRRPRPAANLKFATEYGFTFDPKDGLPLVVDRATGQPTSGNILADVRVRTLPAQAMDALVTHTQMQGEISPDELQRILDFESQLYVAASADDRAGALDAAGASGGPDALAQAPAARLQSSTANPIWGEFLPWSELPAADGGSDAQREFRMSVARGATIFASRQFLVSDTAGITDTGFGNPVRNSCAFCHNMLHAGLDVAPGQVDLGTENWPHSESRHPLNHLPLFRLTCKSDARAHPHLGRVVYTHDPGYALTTGKCIDIGKITAQSLRGLAGRAPYFANGSAQTLSDVIDYYNERYSIDLTDREKSDLLHLLEVL
jgi:hypothetical protein